MRDEIIFSAGLWVRRIEIAIFVLSYIKCKLLHFQHGYNLIVSKLVSQFSHEIRAHLAFRINVVFCKSYEELKFE